MEALLGRHGFTVIDPDMPDVMALARLVAGATLIAGVSGSGLACLGFAQRARGVLAMGAGDGGAAERMLLADRPETGLLAVAGVPDEAAVARFVEAYG